MCAFTSIKTEEEYRAALARVEQLMDAAEGSPEIEELRRLAGLVAAYEDKAFPIEPSPDAKTHKMRLILDVFTTGNMTEKEFKNLVSKKSLIAERLLNADMRLRWHLKDVGELMREIEETMPVLVTNKPTSRSSHMRFCGCGPHEICQECNPLEFNKQIDSLQKEQRVKREADPSSATRRGQARRRK
jgi:antitoxin component HigA of HigAB toxin-antitoxin module